MLIMTEVIGTRGLGVEDGGKDLGYIGAIALVLVQFLLLMFLVGGPLAAGDGGIEGGSRVFRIQVFYRR
jgi:hypothetical protein